jgi:branched-chain amino acid transport system substrate-binding protein
MSIKTIALVAVLGVTAAGLTACGSGGDSASSGDSKTIKLGVVADLTGAAAPLGTRQAAGAKAAADRINADGGVKGRKIELIVRDSKTDPTQAVRVANQLIRSDHVIGIFGATTGSGTLSFVTTATQAKIPIVPPNATAELTNPKEPYTPWVLRDAPYPGDSYPFFLSKMAKDGAKKIGIFYQEDAYGTGSFDLAKSVAPDNGLEVVQSASSAIDASDITAQMTKLVNAKPDAILMITSAPALSGLVLRTATSLGYQGLIYAAEGGGQKAVIDAAQGKTDNFRAPLLVNPDDPNALPELTALMKNDGGVTGYGELLGAEAIAVFEAGLKTGADTGEELRDAIEKAGPIKGFGTAPAEYTKDDHNGFPAENYRWAKVVDGKFVFEE